MHTPTYRIRRIADPRSRGACSWYEIEATSGGGSWWHVATCDDRHEARATLAAIEADHGRRAAEAATRARRAAYARLDAARVEARQLDEARTAARRAGHATPATLAAARVAAAHELRAAAHAFDAACAIEFPTA
jgi:hypothetical protein